MTSLLTNNNLTSNKFTQAIHLDPDNHLLYTKRSAVYTAQSEYQNALVDADKAVEIKHRCVKGWLFKGAALHGLKDLGEFDWLALIDLYFLCVVWC